MAQKTKTQNSLRGLIKEERAAGYRAASLVGHIDAVIAAAANFSRLANEHPDVLKDREVIDSLMLFLVNANVSYLLTCAKQVGEGTNGHKAQVEQIHHPLPSKPSQRAEG
jgi:hypothetical protein